ncbi:MAG TPA: hypothetical protein VLA93_09680 [Pyrinomonadaceae bacterium]|nr:hypothetical protein [Pyrinomonadaceae bacterium]
MQKDLRLLVSLAFLLTLCACVRQTAATKQGPPQPQPLFSSTDPRAVYAPDLDDPWNRIFRLLFTRTAKIHMSSDFPEAGPFVPFTEAMATTNLKISKSAFERTEIGDRAIEPLYPSFITGEGSRQVLTTSVWAQLKYALDAALHESTSRPLLARALMQSDAWAAYDEFLAHPPRNGDPPEFGERRQTLLVQLRQFIKKIALTSDEIKLLRNNYSDAVTTKHLPDLFSTNSGWIEIELLPRRQHDYSAGFRRAARVFIKPRKKPADPAVFVESLKHHEHLEEVEAVGLVVQNLLLNTEGQIVPSPLISDVQFRFFEFNNGARPGDAEPKQLELSRHLLLTAPQTGGFLEFDEKSPAYLTASGNDYTFMSRLLEGIDTPILVPLRKRCAQCHGESLTTMMTYSIHDFPPVPTVRVLNASDNERARYVATLKSQDESYRSLVGP